MRVNVKVKKLSENAAIPKYAHEGDAGFDLVACEDVIIEPGATVKVPTGLAFELPPHYEMQVRPRSGVTLKTKLRVQLGTVDSGYVGEVGVIVDNISQEYVNKHHAYVYTIEGDTKRTITRHKHGTYYIPKGTRIAQAVIKPVEQAFFQERAELSETVRGTGGFGSSGVRA